MKQHQWTNPLLSMLASTAMCAILSFNQPSLRTSDSGQSVTQQSSSVSASSVKNPAVKKVNRSVDSHLEIALTLELFGHESIIVRTDQGEKSSATVAGDNKRKCGKNSSRSARINDSIQIVRNHISI